MSKVGPMINILPWWARAAFFALSALVFFAFGVTHGERRAGQKHIDYVQAQAEKSIKIAKQQQEAAFKTEIKYRDRINVIYKQGAEIEKQIPIYITVSDDQRFAVSNGWVRLYDAAFTGELTSAAADTDHEPSELPISAIAEINTHNATACRQWREQALGWREFYENLRKASK